MPNERAAEGASLWSKALPHLAERVGNATYDSFLRNTVALEFDGDSFVLGVPTQFAKEWLEQRHGDAIGSCLAQVAQRPVAVRMEVTRDAGSGDTPPPPREIPAPTPTKRSSGATSEGLFGGTPLNPRYSFDNFVVADCNRFAHAAALQVAKSPGTSYSPLFIHSHTSNSFTFP